MLLNGAPYPGWLDQVMQVLTEVKYARPVLGIVAFGLIIFGRRRGLVILVGAILTITLSDQLSAHVIKPWVGRIRPSNALADVDLLVHRTHSYSFPSAHAANTFAGALYFSSMAPALTIPLFGLAAVVSYSRVYVGVHYPFDLVAGALLGLGCAALVLTVMARFGFAPRRWWALSGWRYGRARRAPPPSPEDGRAAPPGPDAGAV
jgi:undecaprenyl-diphosphatase